MDRDRIALAVDKCRAHTQTDSLSVFLDLSRFSAEVTRQVLLVLLANDDLGRGGDPMPEQDLLTFANVCRRAYNELAARDAIEAVEFATMITTFVHECRHVHDLKSTRMGSELLLLDLRVYSGVEWLVERLTDWQDVEPDRKVLIPLREEAFAGDFEDIAGTVLRSRAARRAVQRLWTTPAGGLVGWGLSVRQLFEYVAMATQLELLAAIFGEDVAAEVYDALLSDERFQTDYLGPLQRIAQAAQLRRVPYAADPQDASRLVWTALNANSIRHTLEIGAGIQGHADAWYRRFSERVLDLVAAQVSLPSGQIAAYACEEVLEEHAVPGPGDRWEQARAGLSDLQREVMTDMFPRDREAVLLAADVLADFGHMNGFIARHPDYHHPFEYVRHLLAGDLIAVHVRVTLPGDVHRDFMTPSGVPSSGTGSGRMASWSSQRMRLLLQGPALRSSSYERSVLDELRMGNSGRPGLRLRLRL